MRAILPLLALAGTALAGPVAAQQQPLTLRRAFAIADSHAYGNRLARSARDLQAAERDQTFRGILPSVRVEGSWMRTTDPLNAFGSALRQRLLTQASFDPNSLNLPAPISNFGMGLVAEVPLVNPDALLGRRAARSATRAAESSAEWTRGTTQLDIVRAYYGGVLAREQVTALEEGVAAARSHVKLAQSMLKQGMVTRSDVLLAEVKAGELESALLAARGQSALARHQLATALGVPGDTSLVLPDCLPEMDRLTPLLAPVEGRPRADVEAARLGQEAADRDVARATSLLLPRINSFGRLDWNDHSSLAGGRSSWSVGLVASWSLFGGGSELVARQAALARSDAATAQAEAAESKARLELAERRNELDVAVATAAIAARAVDQAAEAHRIVARKYEGGLATITELLESAALETRTRVERSAATYRSIVAAAAWRLAAGADVSTITLLEDTGTQS